MKKIDKPLYILLGQQLKEARLAKGYSLQEVADMIGKNKTSIKRYEDAKVRIDMETLDLLCTVLDLKQRDLYLSAGDVVVKGTLLDPIPESEREILPFEDGYKKKQLADLSEEMFMKFIELDENTQRIVLMMLKMENIDDIVDRLND